VRCFPVLIGHTAGAIRGTLGVTLADHHDDSTGELVKVMLDRLLYELEFDEPWRAFVKKAFRVERLVTCVGGRQPSWTHAWPYTPASSQPASTNRPTQPVQASPAFDRQLEAVQCCISNVSVLHCMQHLSVPYTRRLLRAGVGVSVLPTGRGSGQTYASQPCESFYNPMEHAHIPETTCASHSALRRRPVRPLSPVLGRHSHCARTGRRSGGSW
jgi:hypothetical protein